MKDFAIILKELRERSGYTQQMLADKLNVGRATIAGYETKGKEPDYNKLKTLSEIFNVSIDYLLGNSNIRNSYITVDTEKKANDLSNEILDLLVEMGEITEDEIKTGSIDDKKANELLDKIKKAIKVSQIFKE